MLMLLGLQSMETAINLPGKDTFLKKEAERAINCP